MRFWIIFFSLFMATVCVFAAAETKQYTFEIAEIRLNEFVKSDTNPVYQVGILHDGIISSTGYSLNFLSPIMKSINATKPEQLLGYRFQSHLDDFSEALDLLRHQLKDPNYAPPTSADFFKNLASGLAKGQCPMEMYREIDSYNRWVLLQSAYEAKKPYGIKLKDKWLADFSASIEQNSQGALVLEESKVKNIDSTTSGGDYFQITSKSTKTPAVRFMIGAASNGFDCVTCVQGDCKRK